MSPAAGSRVLLHGGAQVPTLGLGTSPLLGEEARAAVASALDAGYRLIDTSEQYRNETSVGQAVRESDVPREDIFVETKLNVRWHGEDLATEGYKASLERLGLDYANMLLIHWPNPWLDRYVNAWKGLIRLRDEGRVRAIGTSNFTPAHLDRLLSATGVPPEVNQVEIDPTLPRKDWRAFHDIHGIVTECWSPLGRGGALLSDDVVAEVAARHQKTPAQVVLRWHVQLGMVPVVRSSNPVRIAENIDIFDFELTTEDLLILDRLDRGRMPARDPDEHGH
jgi:2,5-diketo-D-gluconate reductase A